MLAGRTFHGDVFTVLAFCKTDKLERNNIGTLVQQLIERVLSVGAGFPKDNRSRFIVNWFAEAVHRLSVGLHIQLLQVSRKAGKRLAVGQDGSATVTEDIPFMDTDQRIHKRGISGVARVKRLLICGGGSGKEGVKGIGAKRERKHRPSAY